MKKMTKIEMVRQIVVAAANEKVNWIDGTWLIETIAKNNYAFAVQSWFDEYINTDATALQILDKMVDMTYMNTSGANGYTETSSRVLKVYWMFK